MQRVRDINIALWFYLFASDALNPVTSEGDFWIAKASQALRLNHNIEHPVLLVGNAVVILSFWFLTDFFLRSMRWSTS